MTFREVTQDQILAALGDGGEDSVLRACVAALRVYSRPSYAIGGSPADVLRETLEVKYRMAASRGKAFIGDDELLLRLQELGSAPVAVVSAQHAGKNFFIYVFPSTLDFRSFRRCGARIQQAQVVPRGGRPARQVRTHRPGRWGRRIGEELAA